MSGISLFLSVSALLIITALVVYKRQNKPRRVMREGRLMKEVGGSYGHPLTESREWNIRN